MEEILDKLKNRVNSTKELIERSLWDLMALKDSIQKSLDNVDGVKAEIDEQFMSIGRQLDSALDELKISYL